MFLLVTGGSGSGKSEYAERRVLELGAGYRIYLATMQCFDEESEKRVQRHRKMRAGKGFVTVERPLDLKGLELRKPGGNFFEKSTGDTAGTGVEVSPSNFGDPGERRGDDPENASCQFAVLLECMSNLAANEMFAPGGSRERTVEEIKRGIDRLVGTCDNLVVVTNEVCSDGILYDPDTLAYQEVLGEINRFLAGIADEVVEVVYGIPVTLKGKGRCRAEN